MEARDRRMDWLGLSIVVGGAAVLAFHPIVWLVRAWVSPTYASTGVYVFLAVCGLFAWSVSSPVVHEGGPRGRAVLLLAASACVRLASRVLAVNVLGALTLAADVYALGVLASLDRRRRAISPGWLAAAFALSLPLERVLQRLVGFPLQQISAAGACALLRAGFDGVRCEGVRLLLNGRDVLVDLPCSGATGLVQLLALFTCLGAVTRPGFRASVAGAVTVVASGLASNALRIAVLAVGIGYRERLGGLDVMSEPWHGLVGLVALALAAGCLVVWSRRSELRFPETFTASRAGIEPSSRLSLSKALAFLAASAAIVSMPSRPVDVAEPMPPPVLPVYLDGETAVPAPLSERERAYFTLFGGGASRARYGASTLMLVSTSSPLRHLHAPDECLTGSGLDVAFVGVDRSGVPSAVYRAVAPDGTGYRVAVTYVSEAGETVSSVAEVAWRWLQSPSTWSAVQRITYWDAPSKSRRRFDDAVALALDLTPNRKERP